MENGKWRILVTGLLVTGNIRENIAVLEKTRD